MENLWNAAYQWLEYRAMPGRSWHAGFQASWDGPSG
jgi:hypothetical protein